MKKANGVRFTAETGDQHLIAHGRGQRRIHRDMLYNRLRITLLQLLQAELIRTAVAPSGKNAGIRAFWRIARIMIQQRIRPDLIHIHIVGIIDHVRKKTSRRAHVDFQSYQIVGPAQPRLILAEPEKFQVKETIPHTERLQRPLAGILQIRRDLFFLL